MLMPGAGSLPRDKRQLLALYGKLSADGRASLVAFAEFLLQREQAGDAAAAGDAPVPEPLEIPRVEGESVVSAIKRLSRSYHMVDRSTMLTQTSSLMTAHIMHGRQAEEVIDELEALFQQAYNEQLNDAD